ncbi:MAG: creatininase family protein [Pseudanabaena sp.]|jgi:creatinine amidohydrolase|uniref:creatininase family protein n=1 Tax=Pseudanabaena mucicola TaxID=71190 RepID=UPI00257564F7|nr:creatininase family protein [Pseudanabaena mucicola]MCA6572742.1 creatininase family protein [Pseudanabaena sp. M53BS1SP1A06MG]MCA6582719.1 creatininase family protein [Pseudanabaena sp. M34BS1SP1A06MG]MCA6590805.1 creatininase family protein [Pseudanabaena sp. M38BS1SP1A06MG]MCA6601796.1 creatininase family protein [Pseudanabaena sp. M57BS1SP1A06MG]MCA6624951.1 creatininase family protein [Pseudanabaena sp. M165S2SP1A06QC]
MSYFPDHRYFAYLTSPAIASMTNKENVVIIQPMGAIEQHGAHLPLIVDAAISIEVLARALDKLDSAIPAYALPPLYYGKSNEHSTFAGTITMSTQTMLAVLTDIAESVYRAGFRKLALMNSHGGQPQILEIVARDLHEKYSDLMIFPLFTWRVPNVAKDLLNAKELELGIHAGDAETSLMLALLPKQVDMDKAVTEYPYGLPEQSMLSMEGANPFAWVTRDLTRSGVLGDARVATKEKGEKILASLVEGWTELIEDIYKFEQPKAYGNHFL